jgi:hypothetical protein
MSYSHFKSAVPIRSAPLGTPERETVVGEAALDTYGAAYSVVVALPSTEH